MLKSLLAKLSASRLPFLVIAGAVGGAAYLGWYWYNRPETALLATYSVSRLILPSDWHTGQESRAIEVLTVRLDKVWAKRIEIDRIAVHGVKNFHRVTVWFPQRAQPLEPKWAFTEGEGGLLQTLQLTNLPPLLAGHSNFEVYFWGEFASYPYLVVSVDAGDANLEATRREEFSPLLGFLARNALWLIVIAVGAIVGAILIYIDKKTDVASRS